MLNGTQNVPLTKTWPFLKHNLSTLSTFLATIYWGLKHKVAKRTFLKHKLSFGFSLLIIELT